jgi:hypothetical protein
MIVNFKFAQWQFMMHAEKFYAINDEIVVLCG